MEALLLRGFKEVQSLQRTHVLCWFTTIIRTVESKFEKEHNMSANEKQLQAAIAAKDFSQALRVLTDSCKPRHEPKVPKRNSKRSYMRFVQGGRCG